MANCIYGIASKSFDPDVGYPQFTGRKLRILAFPGKLYYIWNSIIYDSAIELGAAFLTKSSEVNSYRVLMGKRALLPPVFTTELYT